jgi:hypothetical protein
MDDVYDTIIDGRPPHPGQADFDQAEFVSDLEAAIGPQGPDGVWLAERYERALVLALPNDCYDLLPKIQRVANRHALNVAARP